MKKKLLSFLLTLAMVLGILPQSAFTAYASAIDAASDTEGTVFISYSHDGEYAKGNTDTGYMNHIAVDLADVCRYAETDEYEYDADGDGTNDVTLYHLFAYCLENYDPYGKDNWNVTGVGSGSAYMTSGTWHDDAGEPWDENLNYYVNGSYPLGKPGIGATLDQITLHNGDFIDVMHFSDWNFWTDPEAGFRYFVGEKYIADNDAGSVGTSDVDSNPGYVVWDFTVEAGKVLKVGVVRAYGDIMSGGGTGYTLIEDDTNTIHYGTSLYDEKGSFESESGDGIFELTFNEPGVYDLWVNGTGVSSSAYAKVTVTAPAAPANQAPVLAEGVSAEDTASIEKGKSYEVDLSGKFTDPDGDALTYKVSVDGGESAAADAAYSFTPSDAGTYTLAFSANDGTDDSTGTYTVTLTVTEPEEVSNTVQIGYVTSNGSIDSVTITDSANAPISGASYELVPGSAGNYTINVTLPKDYPLNGAVKAVFSRTPNSSDFPFLTSNNGFNRAERYKTDTYSNTLSAGAAKQNVYVYNATPTARSNVYTTIVLNYKVKNEVPTIVDGLGSTKNESVIAGDEYALDLSSVFTDADGDPLTYKVSVNGAAAVDTDVSYSYTNDQMGTYTLVFTATDGKDTSEKYTVNLTVERKPGTYYVTLASGTGYSTEAAEGSHSPVAEGGSYTVKLNLTSGYAKGASFAIKANGTALTEDSGSENSYTISGITEDKTITVEGITEVKPVIIAPEGSVITVGYQTGYFKKIWIDPVSVETLSDGRVKNTYNTVSNAQLFYRVQNPDGVTYWCYIKALNRGDVIEVSEDKLFIGDSSFTKTTTRGNDGNIADIYMPINAKGYVNIAPEASSTMNFFRNWLPIDSTISNDKEGIPDFHYQVIDENGNPSDLITIETDQYNPGVATMKAGTETGTAIVLVTYDAMYIEGRTNYGPKFGAIWPERTGVFVVTVGLDGTGIATNANISPMGQERAIDAEHDTLYFTGDEGAEYSFTPESGVEVTVARPEIAGPTLSFSGFTSEGVTTDAEGKVTVTGLKAGRNILKAEKDGVATYQVITARKTSYTLKDAGGNKVSADTKFLPGDKVTITFSDLVTPQEKFSGKYNFNWKISLKGEDGTQFTEAVSAAFGVYTFTTTEHSITVTIPSEWTGSQYVLDQSSFMRGGFSGGDATHRTSSYGAGGSMAWGTEGGTATQYSRLPEITLKLQGDNTPPVLAEGIEAEAAQTISIKDDYTLDLNKIFTDEDGDDLTFTVSVDGAEPSSAPASFTFKPEKTGEVKLVFTANDGKEDSQDTYTVILTVTEQERDGNIKVTLKGKEYPVYELSDWSYEQAMENDITPAYIVTIPEIDALTVEEIGDSLALIQESRLLVSYYPDFNEEEAGTGKKVTISKDRLQASMDTFESYESYEGRYVSVYGLDRSTEGAVFRLIGVGDPDFIKVGGYDEYLLFVQVDPDVKPIEQEETVSGLVVKGEDCGTYKVEQLSAWDQEKPALFTVSLPEKMGFDIVEDETVFDIVDERIATVAGVGYSESFGKSSILKINGDASFDGVAPIAELFEKEFGVYEYDVDENEEVSLITVEGAASPAHLENGRDPLYFIIVKYDKEATAEVYEHELKHIEKKDAVCEEDGNEEHYICVKCEKLFADEAGEKELKKEEVTIKALGHDYESTVTKAATFSEAGVRTFTCKNDPKHTYTEDIEKLGFKAELNGKELEIKVIDNGYDASYEDWMTGNKVESYLPLALVTVPCDTENVQITLNDHLDEYLPFYYTRKAADGTGYSEYVDTAFGDSDGTYTIASANTAYDAKVSEDNVVRIQSTYDENWNSDNLYAIGFDFSHNTEKVEEVPATCEETGVKEHFRCSACEKLYEDEGAEKEVKEEDLVIEAIGHDYVISAQADATCTKTGVIIHQCKNNPFHIKVETVEPLGHKYDDGVVTKEATYEEDGEITYTCQHDASHTYTEVIPKKELVTVSVDFTSQMTGGFLHAPQFGKEISSDKAESYGYKDSVDGVSALDVLVAAHELTFGDSFTPDSANDYLVVENGNVDMQFGVEQEEVSYFGASFKGMFFVNHAWPTDGTIFAEKPNWVEYFGTTVGTHKVEDGDLIEFFFNEGSYMDDRYSWFLDADEKYSRSFEAHAGEDLDLILMGHTIPDPAQRALGEEELVNYPNSQEVDSAQIYTVDLETGALTEIDGAVSDYGEVTLTFDEPGTYVITAYEEDPMMYPLVMNLTTITVTDHEWDEGKITKEPGCEDGVKTFTCTICGATKDEPIEATGHVWDEGKITVAPTIGAEGVKTFTCVNDSTHTKEEPVDKVDPAALEEAIEEGEKVLSERGSSEDGFDLLPGTEYTTSDERAAFEAATEAAKEVLNNPDSDEEDVNAAIEELKKAKDAYDEAVKIAKVHPVDDFVTRLYRVCLDREPEEEGFNNWTTALKEGRISGVQAAYGFIFSREFKSKNYCDEHYVEYLYRALLGREFDPTGKAFWIGHLEKDLTREQVFNGFAMSAEFKGLCDEYEIIRGEKIKEPEFGTIQTGPCQAIHENGDVCGKEDQVMAFVKRLYNICLNREPDEGSLKKKTAQLRNGTVTAKATVRGIVFSAEYNKKHPSDEEFVRILYKAVLGRADNKISNNEVNTWVDRIKKNNRDYAFNGIINSKEFRSICERYGVKVQ